MSSCPRADVLKASASQLIPTAVRGLVCTCRMLSSQVSTAPPAAEYPYTPGRAVELAAAGTHHLLCRHPQDTQQLTHHLFRGHFSISCFWSLGQRLISSKEKQSQTIASKLCVRRRAHCSVTDRKQPLVLLLCVDTMIPLQRL